MKSIKRIVLFAVLGVMVLSTTGIGVFADVPEVQGDITPAKVDASVGHITVGELTKTSTGKCNVAISWTGNAAKYVVYKDDSKKGSTLKNAFTVKGFTDGTVSNVKVVPYDAEDQEGESVSKDILAVSIDASAGNGQAFLKWTDVEGERSYKVDIYHGRADGTGMNYDRTIDASDNDITINSLTNKDGYKFVVKTTDGIESPFSAVVVPDEHPDNVKNLKSYHSFEQVLLEWDKMSGVSGYVVTRAASKGGVYEDISEIIPNSSVDPENPGTIQYRDTSAGNGKERVTWYYKVYAINGNSVKTGARSKVAAETTGEPVHCFLITLKTKKAVKRTDESGVTHTLPAGTTVKASGYGGAQYQAYYKGVKYFIPRLAASGQKADWFSNGYNYSKKEAEDFINQRGNTSKTNYMIWISQPCQHLYLFKKSDGKWKVYDHWEIATGKATTPSPTGTFSIWKHVAKRHGLPWWSPFAGWNSLHGKLASWPVGSPASAGCIRNDNTHAKFMYSNCGIGTTVINW